MKIPTMAGTRTANGEPPRSTAYYYADLERLKQKTQDIPDTSQNPDALSEYVETNEVVNDGAVREVPPLRDRRQWSLPEYNTPENSRKIEETYSTAGTFPMPEPKEKEPLLAELEVVGRVPLTQLDSSSGVRRSRSWYLCCPNVGDEEISRESSWRYSSLRPVTAPPAPGRNGLQMMVASQSSGREDISSLRAERDALARALAAERQRAAAAARAHDARLAELHGVIAELVRRRACDKQARAIPEEEVSDECESTTQPAGELDNDADNSRTEQNDTSSALSPELPTPQESKVETTIPPSTFEELPTDTDNSVQDIREGGPRVEVSTPSLVDQCDTSLNLSERDSEPCLTTARCGEVPGGGVSETATGSCERERGSPDSHTLYTPCAGRCETKVASRVRLRKTQDSNNTQKHYSDDWVCGREAALSEAALTQHHDGVCSWAVRCAKLRAERRVLQCALARATDIAHRLYCACAVSESSAVSLCVALRAADQALETYDVLLALAETSNTDNHEERAAAELIAGRVLSRLEADVRGTAGGPLVPGGPWCGGAGGAGGPGGLRAGGDAALRRHAARLKHDTVALRTSAAPSIMFSYHDVDQSELEALRAGCSAQEMEEAVNMQEQINHLTSTSKHNIVLSDE